MCNFKEEEYIIHFIRQCPVLREMCRSKFVAAYLTQQSVIEAPNGVNWKILIDYVKCCLGVQENIDKGV